MFIALTVYLSLQFYDRLVILELKEYQLVTFVVVMMIMML
jgi:hypothetical protein